MTSTETIQAPIAAGTVEAAPATPAVRNVSAGWEIRPTLADITSVEVLPGKGKNGLATVHAPAELGCDRAHKLHALPTPALQIENLDFAALTELWAQEVAAEAAGLPRNRFYCSSCVTRRIPAVKVAVEKAATPAKAATTRTRTKKADAETELDKPLTDADRAKFAAQIAELAGPATVTAMAEAEDKAAIESAAPKRATRTRAPRKAAAAAGTK
jgi:hypothetical protein